LKILVLSQRIPFPPNKGEKLRTYNQIKYLSEQGHSIDLCFPLHSQQDADHLAALQKKFTGINTYQTEFGNKWGKLILGLLSFKPLSVANFYSTKLQQILDRELSLKQYDAILCTSSSLAEYIFRSKTLPYHPDTKLLMDFMDVDSDKWRQYSTMSNIFLRWLYAREARLIGNYEQWIQREFDHCFLISPNEIELFASRHGSKDKLHVLGNGIDTAEFFPTTSRTNHTSYSFLFVGVMDYKPNIEAVQWFVREAWPLIIAQYPDAQFTIAGMNPSESVVKLSQIQGIRVTGFVEHILPYFHSADYFVAPFTIARGVQNKILQAFACGLPVIASSMGAEGIDCEDRINIIIAEQGPDYIDAIRELEQKTDLRSALIKNAIELIQKQYSWPGQLRKLGNILESEHKNVNTISPHAKTD
jgi:sugar transferase (PEP-CTERM/EpsH1 system associated)